MAATIQRSAPKPSLLREWMRDPGGILTASLCGVVTFYILWGTTGWGFQAYRDLVDMYAWPLLNVADAVLCWHAASHPAQSARTRRAWRLFAFGFMLTAVGNGLWSFYENQGVQPFPSLADVAYLAFYPVVLWGIFSFPAPGRSRGERLKSWLDVLTVLVGGSMVLWYFFLQPVASAEYNSWVELALSVGYPLADMVLLLGIAIILLGDTIASMRQAMIILVLGLLSLFAADLLFSYMNLLGIYKSGE